MDHPKLFLKDDQITPALVQRHIVPRSITSKKGDNGVVFVVGGSRLYHGAPILTSIAALKTGVDLVFSAVPESNLQVTRSFSPNLIVLPIGDDKLTGKSTNVLTEMLPKDPDSAAIGMGMSIDDPKALRMFVRHLLSDSKGKRKPKLLLDASALIPEILGEISETNAVITPHPGEYRRIFKDSDDDVTGLSIDERISNVRKNAKRYGITIILKGYDNIICEGSTDSVAVIRRNNPAMTVGGTGDTLSGVTAALLSKMNSTFHASMLGVYFSGIAAGMAYENIGLHMSATDIIERLPAAMKPFDVVKD